MLDISTGIKGRPGMDRFNNFAKMTLLNFHVGANKNAFRMQLESLMSNPGIKPEMVSVGVSV